MDLLSDKIKLVDLQILTESNFTVLPINIPVDLDILMEAVDSIKENPYVQIENFITNNKYDSEKLYDYYLRYILSINDFFHIKMLSYNPNKFIFNNELYNYFKMKINEIIENEQSLVHIPSFNLPKNQDFNNFLIFLYDSLDKIPKNLNYEMILNKIIEKNFEKIKSDSSYITDVKRIIYTRNLFNILEHNNKKLNNILELKDNYIIKIGERYLQYKIALRLKLNILFNYGEKSVPGEYLYLKKKIDSSRPQSFDEMIMNGIFSSQDNINFIKENIYFILLDKNIQADRILNKDHFDNLILNFIKILTKDELLFIHGKIKLTKKTKFVKFINELKKNKKAYDYIKKFAILPTK